MSQQIINVGAAPNDGQGDPIRTAFIKTNTNFTQLFALPNPTPPTTLAGKSGDVPGMYAYDSNYFYYCYGTYTGNTDIWGQVTQIGNTSISNIVNGTSNVSIDGANANTTFGVNGTSNVAVFSDAGVSLVGNVVSNNISASNQISANTAVVDTLSANRISAAGNVVTSGYFIGNFQGNISGNLVVTGLNTQIIYNNNGNAGASASLAFDYSTNVLSVAGNISAQNITATGNIVGQNISTSGNIAAASLSVSGNTNSTGTISTTGNIVGGNFGSVGNISIAGNVSAHDVSSSGNLVVFGFTSVTGNIDSGNFNSLGNISLAGNIITHDINISGNTITTGVISTTANVSAGNISVTGNVTSGNINTVGLIKANGNITGNYFIGDGSLITNLPVGNYSNANVANFLPTYSGNLTAGNVSTAGNVTADYFIGNISANVSNAVFATTAGTVTTNAQPNITSVGTLNRLSVSGNVVASGFVTSTGTFRLPSYTTAQIANIAAVGGDMVYNSDLQLIQAYQLNPATSTMGWVNWTVAVYQ
jgi:hypothetical protein